MELVRKTISAHYKATVQGNEVDINYDHEDGELPSSINAHLNLSNGHVGVTYQVEQNNFNYHIESQPQIDEVLLGALETALKELNAQVRNI